MDQIIADAPSENLNDYFYIRLEWQLSALAARKSFEYLKGGNDEARDGSRQAQDGR